MMKWMPISRAVTASLVMTRMTAAIKTCFLLILRDIWAEATSAKFFRSLHVHAMQENHFKAPAIASIHKRLTIRKLNGRTLLVFVTAFLANLAIAKQSSRASAAALRTVLRTTTLSYGNVRFSATCPAETP
jgi:hypothetical protein